MKQLAIALLLTCLLSISALAGDVPTAGAPQPATTQPNNIPSAAVTLQSDGSTQTSSVVASVILTMISLIGR